MTSLQIAEVTDKRHDNIIRDIRGLLDKGIDALNFEESYYVNTQNKRQPMYVLTKKGCLILASGYNPLLREKIIDRWEELENKELNKIPQSYASALRLAADQAELIEKQQNKIELDKPKVLFADALETSKDSILIGELAKLITKNGYKIGQNRLFIWLRENGYLSRRRGESFNQPLQRYVEMGLFDIKKSTLTTPEGEIFVHCTTKVTGKGQSYFINKFLSK